jgi:hypothetical protein
MELLTNDYKTGTGVKTIWFILLHIPKEEIQSDI